jgi:hypothetical protein
MADDDIQYGDGRMGPPAPKRRRYAAPFGTLPTGGDIQYGDGRMGPAAQEPTNALAMQAAPAAPTADVGVPTPMGWMPTRLASILVNALTPPQQGVADTLAAPADAASWAARRLGISGPSAEPSRGGIAATLGAPVDAAAWAARQMGADIPADAGSQYFQNLMDNPPHAEINALWRAMRRR